MKKFVELQKLNPGDQVAIVSPAGDAAGRFPWVYEFGIERLQKEFDLEPKEYSTTRKIGATHEEKAKDLMAAFTDPKNKAVFATIGGFDQIKMLKLLDSTVFIKNPKPFFGSSDNTQFVNYLWQLGIPSYYCGSIMPQLAFPVAVPELAIEYLKRALFDEGEFEVKISSKFNDETNDWSNEQTWDLPRKMEPNSGWIWDGDRNAEGVLWGGCLESMVLILSNEKFCPKAEDIDKAILFLETSEEIPQVWVIAYVLIAMGERDFFSKLKAVLVGRPKTWHINNKLDSEQKADYKKAHHDIILKTIREYNKEIPIIQNVDFGHTDPQIVVPSGKMARISSKDRKIFFTY